MNKQAKVKLYAKALADIALKKMSGAEEKKVIDNFLKLLTRTNHEKRAKEILDLAESMILAKQGRRKITFETARKITIGQKKLLESFVGEGDIVKEKIAPELIAGIKIIIDNERQFDASMQKKLQTIF